MDPEKNLPRKYMRKHNPFLQSMISGYILDTPGLLYTCLVKDSYKPLFATVTGGMGGPGYVAIRCYSRPPGFPSFATQPKNSWKCGPPTLLAQFCRQVAPDFLGQSQGRSLSQMIWKCHVLTQLIVTNDKLLVCGPVVWISGIPENERDYYLGSP